MNVHGKLKALSIDLDGFITDFNIVDINYKQLFLREFAGRLLELEAEAELE